MEGGGKYDFEIKHHPGSWNTVADCFLRYPVNITKISDILEDDDDKGNSDKIDFDAIQLNTLRTLQSKDVIISRIKHSKYYSISLDSTPDEGHVDHLTLIFRYLEENIPVERFVAFMLNQGHKAKDMFKGLDTFLKENNLDIKNYRGQSYDNASSMSGKYKVLTNCLKRAETENPILIPKKTKTTCWSCRADATKALLRGYKKIKNALLEISENKEELGKSRINDILGQVNKISETLHNPRLDVNTAVLALKSLRSFIGTTRDSFEGYFVKVSELDDFVEYDSETQGKRKINSFLSVIDQLESSLQQRLEAYELVDNRFGFLYKNELIQFKAFYQEFLKDDDGKNDKVISRERWMYQLLIEKNFLILR
ncbi:uncharacterized protein LOC112684011 [Sipha flava]|uniref:Uncharacterized protein LOC112684011 n=1 Tax=Sipha flava TaxID=143950 RepID=A0A8B8FL68_9HEMI|nr:uncharacterized protein LOC112684011 [Sipha flava]